MGFILNMAQRIVDRAWEARHGRPVRRGRGSGLHRTPMHRAYAAAKHDRLTASFSGTALSPGEALRRDLRVIRKRSRQLCMDNDYARKFLHMVGTNVVGPAGIRLQARMTWPDGALDLENNKLIEQAFKDWSMPGNCDVTGKLAFRDVQSLLITAIARDGEVLLRHVDGADNPFRYAVQIIEADHLDEHYNVRLRNGNRIVMGVELDAFKKPVAYHLFTQHPGDNSYLWGGKHYDRVPADEIIHLFIVDRPSQPRGVPWMHTAIRRLNMLGGYEEAELVAARVGASKMGFFTSEDGQTLVPEELGPDDPDAGEKNVDLVQDAEPGVFHELPEGMSFETFDPQHPTTAYADFTKSVLRGAASGLNVAYNSLANDLEHVNFSSIRSGVIEERGHWQVLQQWLILQACMPIYEHWIDFALLTGQLALPINRRARYSQVHWQPRGWDWVDPLKDTKANESGVALGTTTRTEIAAAKGRDLEEMFEQLKREQQLAEQYGIDINPTRLTPQGANNAESESETADE